MTDWLSWFSKQLDETEEVAIDALRGPISESWQFGVSEDIVNQGSRIISGCGTPAIANHILFWQPTRVITSLSADRDLIDHYTLCKNLLEEEICSGTVRLTTGLRASLAAYERAIKLRMMAYADQPGYQKEKWKP